MNYKNYETRKFKEEYIDEYNFNLSDILDEDITDEDLEIANRGILEENTVEQLRIMAYDIIDKASQDAWEWAKIAIDNIDFQSIAEQLISDWIRLF